MNGAKNEKTKIKQDLTPKICSQMMIAEIKDVSKKKEVQSSDSKPGKLLRCPHEGCGKVFRSSPGYRYHLRSHDIDPRPHVCQCCHKKFKSANGLKYHLRKAHHIEPVLSKQNLGATSPKSRESISSEEDPYMGMSDSYSRNFINGSALPPPLVKSPLNLASPLMKNLPGIPSPLIKSPMDMNAYLSGGSTGSTLQSPYANKETYSGYYEKLHSESSNPRNGEFPRSNKHEFSRPSSDFSSGYSSRSSLSEYTQQCQQANNQFRQQIQRLSTGDLSNPHVPTTDPLPGQRSSCQFYSCHKTEGGESHLLSYDSYKNASNSMNNDPKRNTEYSCVSGDKLMNGMRDYPNFRDVPNPTYESNSSRQTCTSSSCKGSSYPPFSSSYSSSSNRSSMCDDVKEEPVFESRTSSSSNGHFKVPRSVHQNSEQIVPDITTCATSPTGISGVCDPNNNNSSSHTHSGKNLRGHSESSNETELSDCVFQNENSNPPFSSPNGTEMISLSSTIKKEKHRENCVHDNTLSNAKPLYCRRTSRTKSIPPALVINPSPSVSSGGPCGSECKKDLTKIDSTSRLRYLMEAAVTASPRSPYHQSPLTLTPSMLPPEGTPDWIKSPSKFSFPEKPSFLLTPTISRMQTETSHTDTLITSTTSSLPASPFLDNIQTPSFWPTQTWPTPVWLCFQKGCAVKFEKDDSEFMSTEDVAVFCTTPGGRRRDDMNYYTSGMKIVEIKEKQSLHSARVLSHDMRHVAFHRQEKVLSKDVNVKVQDMVELTFEQRIPGTQRLVAKCPSDHPFYVKSKGWSASNTTDAMARYGASFKALQKGDTVISHQKTNLTPAHTLSPKISNGAQVFTFSAQDTSRFTTQQKACDVPQEKGTSPNVDVKNQKSEGSMPPPSVVPDEKPASSTVTSTAAITLSSNPTSNVESVASDHKPRTTTVESFSSADTKHLEKQLETITLTYSEKSPRYQELNHASAGYPSKPPTSHLRLANELKSISEDMKRKQAQDITIKADPDKITDEKVVVEDLQNGSKDVVDVNKKGSKKKRRKANGCEKDRRPMNGFMLFAKEMRVELTKLFPGKDNRAISKLLGERWRELSEEKREDYSKMAKEMADERMKVNPDCWKRKHKKEKETADIPNSSGKQTPIIGELDGPENKKIRLTSPTSPNMTSPNNNSSMLDSCSSSIETTSPVTMTLRGLTESEDDNTT